MISNPPILPPLLFPQKGEIKHKGEIRAHVGAPLLEWKLHLFADLLIGDRLSRNKAEGRGQKAEGKRI